jgi:predicted DNA-binding protein (MmcQ/YjbR family)
MNIEELRSICLGMPGVTEDIKWGNDLCFSVGGKMFAITSASPTPDFGCTLKCDPETFARLIERENIEPAAYVGRYHWIAVKRADALSKKEWKERIKASYDEVFAKLPPKIRKSIQS